MWLPYVLPMASFLAFTALEPVLPAALYPVSYTLKVVVTALVTAVASRHWKAELRPDARVIVSGIVVGLLGLGVWLGLDRLQPAGWALGARTAYNPFLALPNPAFRAAFLVVRFFGLAVLVPLVEEVFWRSFLLRWLTNQDKWRDLPMGTFSAGAFAGVAALFAVAHPEWLAALGYAVFLALLLRSTKSLTSCLIAHAVTNAALGIYVLQTGSWHYW